MNTLRRSFTYLATVLVFVLFHVTAYSQKPALQNVGNRLKNVSNTGSGSDSLKRRDKLEDSITIHFRYLDSTRNYWLDSSVNDFSRRFPLPATHISLGNTGTATRSLLFNPVLSAGFDAGFHAFDAYTWKLQDVRFFQVTRPYSEINYLLGSRSEQIISVLHTQNVRPAWNVAFQYRLINSPGFFNNQNTNHNNYILSSRYQSKNLRYTNYFALAGNKMASSENGGMVDTADVLNDPDYKDRFNISTYLGGTPGFSSNFFSTKMTTGNKYGLLTVMMRQQYDLGRKDSLVTDSTVIPLFYPRLRFEHSFQLDRNKYSFEDFAADSVYYKTFYDTAISNTQDTFALRERWQSISNDFSIYQFPDAKNLHQFIKLGLLVQNLHVESSAGKENFFNTAGHAEYRNKTRNQLWDIEANGKLYFTGLNAGDYEAHLSLQRLLGKKIGYLKLGFSNVNRTPSFVFDNRSSFYFLHHQTDFKKENTTVLSGEYFLPSFKLKLDGKYYLLTNYTYLKNYYELQQQEGLFNVFQLGVSKTITVGKHWHWHIDIYFQKVIGNAEVNLPVIYTRNRIGYEGNLGFKNLNIAFGLEGKYRPAYKADGYSPLLGRFFYQDSITIRNPLPDIAAYVHFRIKPFKAFIRAENLNTARNLEGFSFTRNNLVAPGYALPGLQIQVGIYWSFVN